VQEALFVPPLHGLTGMSAAISASKNSIIPLSVNARF
jgi:hypothetical protein